jgi:hypothetical protein
MLKTPSAALALPMGCSWSPRHPITERIAMLKLSPPGRARRTAGHLVLLGIGLIVTSSLYAATAAQSSANGSHRLKIELGVNGDPTKLHADICLRPGGFYEAIESADPVPTWHTRFWVETAPKGQLLVKAEISGGTLDKTVHPGVGMLPGQTGTIQIGNKLTGKDGKVADRTLKVDLTPSVGC